MILKTAAILLAGTVAFAPAALAAPAAPFARFEAKKEKPEHGQGGHDKSETDDHGRKAGDNPGADHGNGREHAEDHHDWRFKSSDRDVVMDFYRSEYGAGRCPPGLAKKNNGCLPPGQAKKVWARGEYLPADYAYYDLPDALYDRLQAPPYGYRYVAVDGDVMLIELASRLIVDLILAP